MELNNYTTRPEETIPFFYVILMCLFASLMVYCILNFLIKYTKNKMGQTFEEQTSKTQSQMINWVKNSNPVHYKKFGSFTFEKVSTPQLVETFIDGKKETEKHIVKDDYILTGAKNERYGVDAKTFVKRYNVKQQSDDGLHGVAVAKGEAWGIIYSGPSFEFVSPWKDSNGKETTMICEDGDSLVSPDPDFTQVYRIEKEAFLATYKEA